MKIEILPNMFTRFILFFIFLFPVFGVAQNTVNYQISNEDFPNPERGFYFPTVTLDNGNMNAPLTASGINNLRNEYTPFNANYEVHSTLIYYYFDLDNYFDVNDPNNILEIDQSYLDYMQQVFNNIRAGKAKIIPRFSYTRDGSEFDPPYGDASKAQVLQHIEDLTPVLRANADVIATVQMGFIGIYGENYYTDFFGDASTQGFLNNTNWQDRIDVINALLNALPTNRTVQVRYPQFKQKVLYGVNAPFDPTQSPPVTAANAYDGSTAARIGFHNDCFLANPADFGTFISYDENAPYNNNTFSTIRNYKASDSQFVPVGGETCAASIDLEENPSGEEKCLVEGGRADSDLALFHYSFLNGDYNNPAVNNKWKDVCLDDIKRKLGYRFELQNSTFPATAQAGHIVNFQLNLSNVGYAAPFNPRGVELVLKNTSTDELWFAKLPDDPRFWSPENSPIAIDQDLCLPSDMPSGTYQLYLHLPDPESELYGVAEYAIRTANKLPNNSDVWDANTGYNALGQPLIIDNSTAGTSCNGEIEFTSQSSIVLSVNLIQLTAKITPTGNVLCEWKMSINDLYTKTYVQRSTDGLNFFDIQYIPQNITGQYAFFDKNVQPNQDYYYRLKHLKEDGNLVFSNTVHVETKEELWTVFVDHSSSSLQIFNKNQAGIITIFNAVGQQVELLSIAPNTTKTVLLPKGAYYLQLRGKNSVSTKKVILQ